MLAIHQEKENYKYIKVIRPNGIIILDFAQMKPIEGLRCYQVNLIEISSPATNKENLLSDGILALSEILTTLGISTFYLETALGGPELFTQKISLRVTRRYFRQTVSSVTGEPAVSYIRQILIMPTEQKHHATN